MRLSQYVQKKKERIDRYSHSRYVSHTHTQRNNLGDEKKRKKKKGNALKVDRQRR